MTTARPAWLRPAAIGLAVALAIIAALAAEVIWTRPMRSSLQTYYALIGAANREDSASARALCSQHYLQAHALKPAPEGGLVGLPRGINKNFKAWRQGPNIWLCPTNRVGPVYQFVPENGQWLFDGPIGLLQSDGQVERMNEMAEQAVP